MSTDTPASPKQDESPAAQTNVNTSEESTVKAVESTTEVDGAEWAREHLAINGWTMLGICLFAFFFAICNYMPLFHTDLWGHVAYGEWILQNNQLPAEDPFTELAAGVPAVDNAWLSQVIFGSLSRLKNPELLSHLFAIASLATMVVWLLALRQRSWSLLIGVVGAFTIWSVNFGRLGILRPETFGNLCFAGLLLCSAVIDDWRKRQHLLTATIPAWAWVVVPGIFVLWANLHGSFIVGFGLFTCLIFGRAAEVLWDHGKISALWNDAPLRSDIMLSQLCLLATILNPYGIDLLLNTLMFPSHPNLKDVIEWYPLEMLSHEGIPMAMTWIATAFALRFSRVRFRTADIFMLLLFNLAVCMRVRMIAWYAPIVVYVLAPHFGDILRQLSESARIQQVLGLFGWMGRRSIYVTMATAFFVWCAFSFSPISQLVLGGKQRDLSLVYSHETPIDATAYLKEHPPLGTIFAPQWWGDWIVYSGPDDIQVMVTTNTMHLTPHRVWRDYMAISRAERGYLRLLNRYRMNTVVVHKQMQQTLARDVPKLEGWKIVYEDDEALIAERIGVLDGTSTSEPSQKQNRPTTSPEANNEES